jgi:PTH1 family peptidyl-tRNA hydrolase
LKLIVGLGNPGPKYETTRHNAGFLLLDQLAEEFEADWSGEKFHSKVAKGTVYEQPCILIKPMTFMNLSGQSVGQFLKYFKLPLADMIVIHDDIDVPPSKVKARIGGGHGGHNGIRNIIDVCGSPEFHRIKVGVGKPPADDETEVVNWVLDQFTDEELLSLQGNVYQDVLLRLKAIFQQQIVQ